MVDRGVAGVVRPDPVGLLLAPPALLGLPGSDLGLGGPVGGPLVVFGLETIRGQCADGRLVPETIDSCRGGCQVALDEGQLIGDGGEPLARVGDGAARPNGRSSL